ncbi:MAG: formylglycine-generating enzyme family protein, partial [Proteobacteria bacterium]|nr:formylglycine-generating enzyme family protein [Pseudomonadota bacterium]
IKEQTMKTMIKMFIAFAFASCLVASACRDTGKDNIGSTQLPHDKTRENEAPKDHDGNKNSTSSSNNSGNDGASTNKDPSACSAGQISNGPGGTKFSCIPAGSFMMGSPESEPGRLPVSNEGPQHKVTLSKGFEMQTTEVTQRQWIEKMGENPSYFYYQSVCEDDSTKVNGIQACPNNPVESVSWFEVQSFIEKLNAIGDGYRYGLPTEAQWEYAARAGTTTPYAGDPDAMVWYSENAEYTTRPVATKKANAWGLFDMHGNVSEWTADWVAVYTPDTVTDPATPLKVPTSSSAMVMRGGNWHNHLQYCRSAYRIYVQAGGGGGAFGFRLIRTKL